MSEVPSSPQPQKLSRYRSQRKPSTEVTADEVLATPQLLERKASTEDSFTRSKSRYRRRPSGSNLRPAAAGDQEQIAVVQRPSTDHTSLANDATRTQPGGTRDKEERRAKPTAEAGARDVRRIRSQEIDWDEEDERRQKLRNRFSIQRPQELKQSTAKPVSAGPTPAGELFPPPQPEQVKSTAKPVLVDRPPTSDQIKATRSNSALPVYGDDYEDDGGCFGLFKRKRGESAPQGERTPIARPSHSREPATIRPGGGGIVPGTDAPVSAVNAGDRHVLVECGKSKLNFLVTPTTTPVDVMKTAALSMPERIDVKSAVLLEYFKTVGVQRPLRRYEHIRDVMNSWDTDKQNSLILLDPGTGSSEAELSILGAPREKPGDENWYLSFSQKVGKWDKRLITLKSDGQMIMQKDPNKPDDVVNICHLSDFDVYTPTREKLRKKIKPPKKICFAIKSQQKTTMFESTHDYVHFFCTNDRVTANDFYAAVQGWRSWYLVNVMGEGKKPKSSDGSGEEKDFESVYANRKSKHRQGNSPGSRCQLGSYKPLLDADDFEKRPETSRSQEDPPHLSGGFKKSSNQFDTTISPERRTSTTRRKQQPPRAMSNKAQLAEDEPLGNLNRRASVDRRQALTDQTKASPEEFLSTGLLGRSYSHRQREHTERENKLQPTTSGPNLLSSISDNREDDTGGRKSPDGFPRRTHSTRAQHAHKLTSGGDLQRSNSRTRDIPKPLVDLTPQYREPPQHSKKGRGYNPDSAGPGPLIENATSPEDPLGIPPSTDWRAHNALASHNRSSSPSRNKANAQSVRRPATSRDAIGAFTGDGLLAGSQGQSGWGGGDRGRGVTAPDHGPLLDLTEQSEYSHGSLLNKVERTNGPDTPIIDRSREGNTRAW